MFIIGIVLIALGLILVTIGVVMVMKEPQHTVVIQQEPVIPFSAKSTKEITEEMGASFEKYIVDLLDVHNRSYAVKLLEWQGDKIANGVYATSTRNPDLLVSFNIGGGQIRYVAIECKWRNSFVNDMLEWTTKEKIEIYSRFGQERQASVFVALGIGGVPERPLELYIVPLRYMMDPVVSRPNIAAFRQNVTGHFYYEPNGDRLKVIQSK